MVMRNCECDCECEDDSGVDVNAVAALATELRDMARTMNPLWPIHAKLRDWSDRLLAAVPAEYQPMARQKKALYAHREKQMAAERARLRLEHLRNEQILLERTLGFDLIATGWQPLRLAP